jgi:hypothetical protein
MQKPSHKTLLIAKMLSIISILSKTLTLTIKQRLEKVLPSLTLTSPMIPMLSTGLQTQTPVPPAILPQLKIKLLSLDGTE